jgi:hypothetical protein
MVQGFGFSMKIRGFTKIPTNEERKVLLGAGISEFGKKHLCFVIGPVHK